jgi:hypothetical protein
MPDLSPSQKFATRLDAHLKTLPGDRARASFLEGQKVRWTNLYAEFDRKAMRGEEVEGRAIDYLEIMSEITGRLHLLQMEVAYA